MACYTIDGHDFSECVTQLGPLGVSICLNPLHKMLAIKQRAPKWVSSGISAESRDIARQISADCFGSLNKRPKDITGRL